MRAGLWKWFLNSSKVDPKVYNTADSQVVTQPGTDAALQDLTSVIGREPVLSLWCGRRRRERVKSCSIAQKDALSRLEAKQASGLFAVVTKLQLHLGYLTKRLQS